MALRIGIRIPEMCITFADCNIALGASFAHTHTHTKRRLVHLTYANALPKIYQRLSLSHQLLLSLSVCVMQCVFCHWEKRHSNG